MPDGIGLVAAIGGFILAATLLFAVLANRRRADAVRRTEQATHELYEKVDREDKRTDPDPSTF